MNEGDNLEDLGMEGLWTVISRFTHTYSTVRWPRCAVLDIG